MYITTFIYTQKLSPTFLQVSQFYDKLVVVVKNFQNYSRQVTFLFFDLKVHFLFSPPLGRPFLRKNTNSPIFCGYSFLLRILLRILLKILLRVLLRILLMIFSQVFSLRILLRILPMHFIPRNSTTREAFFAKKYQFFIFLY